MISGLAIVLMAIGLAGVLRAVAIVGAGGDGLFALDPYVSRFGGVGFGQTVLQSQ